MPSGAPVDSADGTVAAGGIVSTNSTTSTSDPVGTAVTTPNAGEISISEQAISSTPPAGYEFVGQEVVITAPPTSPVQPLKLVFQVDSSVLLSGADASNLVMFRDGVAVGDCSGIAGQAQPDPCVSARETADSGAAKITVLSSHASHWNFGVVTDHAPPVVSCGAADGRWHASNVSISCSAQDAGSGLANPTDASFSLSTSVPAGTDTANAATSSRKVCDKVGNCTTAGPVEGNMIDRKAPTITLASPANGARYSFLGTLLRPAHVSYSCADAGSGIASCVGTQPSGAKINTSLLALGKHTLTVTAADNVGNRVSVTHAYTVGL
jgi:hypothetical protein